MFDSSFDEIVVVVEDDNDSCGTSLLTMFSLLSTSALSSTTRLRTIF